MENWIREALLRTYNDIWEMRFRHNKIHKFILSFGTLSESIISIVYYKHTQLLLDNNRYSYLKYAYHKLTLGLT